jgi:hypothetical protein
MKQRNLTPEARRRMAEAGRQAQIKRWANRAPFEAVLLVPDGIEYARDPETETVYLLLQGDPIPAGCESLGVFDMWGVKDRHGTNVLVDLTKEQAKKVCAELQAPFDAEATP